MQRTLISIITLLSCLCVTAADNDSTNICVATPRSLQLKRSISGAGAALVFNAAATEVLKHSIHETRPDRSDNSSFPSRHSSYAFTLASIGAHELARYSPIWVTVAHTTANAVAMQRVFAARHYPSDALAGAATGLLSTEAGYALSRLIFGSEKHKSYQADNHTAIEASTTALLSLSGHSSSGYTTGCGIESAIAISVPTSVSWGLGATFRLRDTPVYIDGIYAAMLKSFGLTVDIYYNHAVFDGTWAAEGHMSLGLLRNFSKPDKAAPAWSALGVLSTGLFRQLDRRLSIGCRIGCELTHRPGSDCAISIGLVTKAMF